jgi:hypothetical protein
MNTREEKELFVTRTEKKETSRQSEEASRVLIGQNNGGKQNQKSNRRIRQITTTSRQIRTEKQKH